MRGERIERDALAERVRVLEAEAKTVRADALEEAAGVARRVVRRPFDPSDIRGAAIDSAAAKIERGILSLRALTPGVQP